MLKAQDIRVVTFDKGMRGYNTEDVDAFLSQVADQVEMMEAEKAEIEGKADLENTEIIRALKSI